MISDHTRHCPFGLSRESITFDAKLRTSLAKRLRFVTFDPAKSGRRKYVRKVESIRSNDFLTHLHVKQPVLTFGLPALDRLTLEPNGSVAGGICDL